MRRKISWEKKEKKGKSCGFTANKFRAMPPIWNNGIMFKFTSLGESFQDCTMHNTPTNKFSSV